MRPTLILNPRHDEGFVQLANGLVSDVITPSELEKRLRERYARAVVRPRELSDEELVVWYVYRDGHWIS